MYNSIYKKMLMKPEVLIPNSNHCATGFHHFVNGFVLEMPCIQTNNKTVFVNDLYSLIDFSDNGGILESVVRFFDAYIRGYVVTIVVVDLDTGELIKRKHRLNISSLPCDWVLTDHFNPKNKTDDLLDFDYE
jgi:hypothetical protein